jgi:hypothetical protein
MARWQKKPYWLRDAGFIGLTAAARGVFVSLYELMADQPVLRGNMGIYSRWTGIDRHTLMRAFEALADAGLLRVEYGDKSIITITNPHAEENANAMPTHSERNANAYKPDADLTPSSYAPDVDLTKTSPRPDVDLMQTSPRPGVKFSTQESSNDAGLRPAKTPLEENRIEENRKEKKRKEEKSAPVGAASAEPPSYYGALTLEEAQQVIAEYHEKYPYRERINDRHTGEPMSDMDWGHAIMMVWKQDRAKELGLTEKPKDPPKVTIMDTRAAGKVKVERPEDCDEQVWKDWMRVRGRNALTETAWGAMLGEARKAGITPAEAVRVCAERGWRGFRADWLSRDKVSRPGRREEVDIAAIWGRKPEFEREA